MSLRSYEDVMKAGCDPTRARILKIPEKGEWLNDDPLIRTDLERSAMARDLGPVAICERGMALPGRKTVRCRTPRGWSAVDAR